MVMEDRWILKSVGGSVGPALLSLYISPDGDVPHPDSLSPFAPIFWREKDGGVIWGFNWNWEEVFLPKYKQVGHM